MNRLSSTGHLSRGCEEVWDRLRTEFELHTDFWLAFLFGGQSVEIEELKGRSSNLVRLRAQRVDELLLSSRENVDDALRALLAPHPPDVAMTWVVTEPALTASQAIRLWVPFLGRLNERREALRRSHPAGLVLACPPGSLPEVRDQAPDLWSYRALTATLGQAPSVQGEFHGGEFDAFPDGEEIAAVSGPPIWPSPALAPTHARSPLRCVARLDRAVAVAGQATALTSDTDDDVVLLDAWLAQLRMAQGEIAEGFDSPGWH